MRNHCELPAVRDPDPRFLEDLRAVDPALDCHYVGEGKWAVGSVKPSQNRYSNGVARKKAQRPGELGHRLGCLGMQGFAVIALFDVQGELTNEHVEDLRCVDWRYRHERKLAIEEALDIAEGLPERRERRKDEENEWESRAIDGWAYMFRGKKSFQVPKALHDVPAAVQH